MSTDNSAEIERLKGLLAELEAEEPERPDAHRPAAVLAERWAIRKIDALEEDDAEGLEMSDMDRGRAPLWARHLFEVDQFVWGMVGGALIPMRELASAPEAIWVRWDAIPRELRDATASAESALVDGVVDDVPHGGRPRKGEKRG